MVQLGGMRTIMAYAFSAAIVCAGATAQQSTGLERAIRQLEVLQKTIDAPPSQPARADAASVRFNRDIRPIFAQACFTCHGNDPAKRKAGLRLDEGHSVFDKLKSGAIPVVPGKRDTSELWRRINSTDPDEKMPPPDSGKSISPDQIEAIGNWIDEGARWERHWSFLPPVRMTPPSVENAAWPRNTLDRFVLAEMERRDLTPSPEADRRALIRRLTYDLHGLPPTPEEINAFVNDPSPDAYECLVDRLLASPRYGERWGRHWLDVVHYGDTHGYDKDKRRPNAWPYRDYVIEALNEDLPYGRFVEEQLAGDVLYPNDPDGVVATGFIAAGPWDFVGQVEVREGTKEKMNVRLIDRDDMVMTAMNTFVSMTVQCGRCHDHKFDPIPQADYYGLQADFAGVDRANRPYDSDPANHVKRQALLRTQRELERRLTGYREEAEALAMPLLTEVNTKLDLARQERDAVKKRIGESPTNGYHSEISATPDAVKWVQVDLGSEQPIDEIRLIPARPTDFQDTPGFGFPRRFKVEISNDPEFESAVALDDQTSNNFDNPGDTPYVIPGQSKLARYVRVTATHLWERSNDYVFALAEMEVMSNKSNIAAAGTVSSFDSIESGRWSMRHLIDGYSSRKALHETPEMESVLREAEHQVKELELDREAIVRSTLPKEVREDLERIERELPEIERDLKSLPDPNMVYAAASDFAKDGVFAPAAFPREVHILNRGDVSQPAELAVPGALSAVVQLDAQFAIDDPNDEGARRADLAKWITDPRNPLTWRSIVNRVWHYHFGNGIVDTPNDFGHMGSLPTHPELLDWLALEFLDHGQSLKWLHKLIVTSATYRQSSRDNETNAAIDGNNQYLWRMNRSQLDAESIRDSILFVSGTLDFTMGGPGYDLFGFIDDHSPHYLYEEHDPDDPKSLRRSVYRFIVRSVPDPLMTTLDCADPSQQVPVRNSTITALQALALLNDAFMVRQAQHFADRIAKEASTPEAQIAAAYRLAIGREPTTEELTTLIDYTNKHGLPNACRVILNSNEFMFVD